MLNAGLSRGGAEKIYIEKEDVFGKMLVK